jgi:hypothetical protein
VWRDGQQRQLRSAGVIPQESGNKCQRLFALHWVAC